MSVTYETRTGWWTLTTEGVEPDDTDLDHIAEMVRQGYTNGQIVVTNVHQVRHRRTARRLMARTLLSLRRLPVLIRRELPDWERCD